MTTAILESLRRVANDLDAVGAAWALVGGLAVSARAEPRFTRDVDICVAVSDDTAAEQLVAVLSPRGYAVAAIVEHTHQARLSTVRLASPVPRGLVVDLLFASSGAEAEIVAAAETLELVSGLLVPVATSPHLVVLKLLANEDERPQDAADLLALRPLLTGADETEVRRLSAVVVERGFGRGRDLVSLADRYLSRR